MYRKLHKPLCYTVPCVRDSNTSIRLPGRSSTRERAPATYVPALPLIRELYVDRTGDDILDQIIRTVLDAIRGLESDVTNLSADVEDIQSRYTDERTAVQQEREEKDIFYSLETGTPYLVAAPDTVELRERERTLTALSMRAAALERKLGEFSTVLSVSRRQFESGEDAPDVDFATDVALRIARIQSQEDERKRIARDIHDGPAQAFANAIIGLEFVERAIKMGTGVAPTLSEIERIKGSLREGLTEIRRFMFDLKPTMLQDRGLVATIDHYVNSYRSILPMDVQVSTDTELPPMTFEQEMTAFRVIQESLHNATKYARATQVAVEIKCQASNSVSVTVRDNGRGFEPSQVTAGSMGGTGIKGMKERAELVGAAFHVESSPGQGCSVYLVLPGAQNE